MAAAVEWFTGTERDAHAGTPAARPVLLLHGFASSPRTLAFLARHVRRNLRRPVLRPDLGLGFGDLRDAAERAYDAVVEAGAPEVDVVGHSLGGLVASYLLKRIDRGRRVRRVITLGAPHAGTRLAWLGAVATRGLARGLRQMLPGSRLLAELAAEPVPRGTELLAIAGDADAVVAEHSALLDSAARQRSHRLANVDHLELVFHRDVLAYVGELLGAADAAPLRVQPPRRAARRAIVRDARKLARLVRRPFRVPDAFDTQPVRV
jgi:pimeloyl-ACP methyl ester carboxylesterase